MNLSEIISRFDSGPTVNDSDGLVVTCPAHPDSHPSLKLTLSDEGKLLLNCRAGCYTRDVLDAVGLRFSDIEAPEVDTDLLVPKVTTALTTAALDDLKVYTRRAALEFPHSPAAAYARDRFGITEAQAAHLKLGFSTGTIRQPGMIGAPWNEVPRLVVPFLDADGNTRGAQARALDPTYSGKAKWCSLTGEGWSKVAVMRQPDGLDTWIVTEGPGDALTVFGAGLNAVAVRGAALSKSIDVLADLLKDKLVLVAGDNDQAGRRFTTQAIRSLDAAGVKAYPLTVPDRYNDITEWYAGLGPAFTPELSFAILDRADAPEDYPFTDRGNALRVADARVGELAFVPETGKFMLYYDGVWITDSGAHARAAVGVIEDQLRQESGRLLAAAVTKEDEKKALAMFLWAKQTGMTGHISGAVRELQGLVEIPLAQFDTDPDLLCFRNCVVNLVDGSTMEHDPLLYMTQRVEVDYDPNAPAPRWEQFLNEVFPDDPSMPSYIQRLVGYGITGRTNEQCMVFHWGTGANGKSVFLDALNHVFNQITKITPFSAFESRAGAGGDAASPAIAALRGVRLALASEGEAGAPMGEAKLKSITGGEAITARHLYKGLFTFQPEFLLMMATNHRPQFRSQDPGLWRRVKLVPWTRYFEDHERDHYLFEKLRAEAAGIAAWAVAGAVEWRRSGLRDPESVTKATKDFKVAVDPLQGFMPGELVQTNDRADRLKATEVYALYTAWTDGEGLQAREHWNRSTLLRALEERGCPRVKSGGFNFVAGIRKATAADRLADSDE